MRMRVSALLLLVPLLLLFSAAEVSAQTPPGRQVANVIEGEVASHHVFGGLVPGTLDGATGTLYMSNDGGETWFEDGYWEKDGNNVKCFSWDGGQKRYSAAYGGVAKENEEGTAWARTEGDVVDLIGNPGEILYEWMNP